MEFSQTDCERINRMASIYMRIADIAMIMGVDEDALRTAIADRSTPVSQAYFGGKMGTKIELQKQETMLAKLGSPLALQNMRDNLMDMDDDE